MATPNRRQILTNLQSALEGINEADGYKTTVDTVEIHAKTWAQVPMEIRPWVGIVPGVENWEWQPGECIRVKWTLTLICHVHDDVEQEVQLDNLNDMLDDIVVATQTDTTRGGYAVMTTILNVQTDEGAPEGGASMVIGLEIVYFRTQGAS